MSVDSSSAQSPAASSTALVRDDRIYRETRWLAATVVPFLLWAFVVLYLMPGSTARHWAWTIAPNMTSILMGAGYIAGAYFFIHSLLAKRWHHVSIAFPPVAAFVTAMAVATVLHWDRFDHTHPAFIAWAGIYAVTPFLVLGTWIRNQRTDPRTPAVGDVLVPRAARWVMGFLGVVLLLGGLYFFLIPSVAIAIWPWRLSPLTARVVAGWFLMPSVYFLLAARERRWSALRLAFQGQILWILLLLIGAARFWSEFDQGRPMTWVFLFGMAVLLAGAAALYALLERRRP
jgi:hypothetical protein